MSRRLEDIRLAVLMLDGVELKGRCNVVALGITTESVKVPLGLWEGSTENAAVATALLADLVDRGLDVGQGVLCVLDGAKALRKAVRDVLGTDTPVQRCVRHKQRNVLEHLPERDRPAVKRRLRAACKLDDHDAALARLQALAGELERSHPGAAASLREGMAETLTVTRLGIRGALKRTLESTNPCESMIECVRRTSRNVKHWMAVRRHGAQVDRCRHARSRAAVPPRDRLPRSRQARPRDRARPHAKTTRSPTAEEAATLVRLDHHTGTVVAKFHDERDILGRPWRTPMRFHAGRITECAVAARRARPRVAQAGVAPSTTRNPTVSICRH